MDVINFISKVPELPDAPIQDPTQEFQSGKEYYACGPRLHEFLKELGAILKEYDAFSVGEMPDVSDPEEILKSVMFDRGELSMVFHFEMYSPFLLTQLIPRLTSSACNSTMVPAANSHLANGACPTSKPL